MPFSFPSLEETYEALRTFKVLQIEKPEITASACSSVVNSVSSISDLKELYHALRVNDILKCELNAKAFEVTFVL